VTLRGTRAQGAFGTLNVPTHVVTERLRMALKKAKAESFKLAEPTTRKYPLERLRRSIASAMALDVIFSPKIIAAENSKWPNSRLPRYKRADISPVWKTAPQGAYYKTNRFCSLLHTLATSGWKANIVHDLVRLSINIWTMTKRSFDGLCHRILSRIYIASHEARSSPDPVLRFGALSTNPICNPYSVYRLPDRRDYQKSQFGVSHLPRTLGLHLEMRRALWPDTLSVQVVCATRDVVLSG